MVVDSIMRTIENFPDKPAIMEKDKVYTYSNLAEGISRMTGDIQNLDLKNNEPVGIFLCNSFHFLVTLLACESTGHPSVLLSTTYKDNELGYHLFHAGIRYVVTDDRMGRECGRLQKKIASVSGLGIWENTEKRKAVVYCRGDFICQLTSGTDGKSKGAVRTSYAVEREICETEKVLQFTATDVFLTLPPLCHSFGLIAGALLPLTIGGTLVLLPAFGVAAALESMERNHVTVVFAVPFMYKMIACSKRFDTGSLAGVQVCISAGAPMGNDVVAKFLDIPGLRVVQDYGSTETGVISIGDTEKEFSDGLVGNLVGDRKLQIRDRMGNCVSPNVKGRIYTKSDCNLRCYLYPKEKNGDIEDGWLDLGDTGFYDHDGKLHVCGRESSMINVGGLKVDPAEVEAVISEIPHVREVVVVGVKHPMYGEVVKAVIVPDAPLGMRDIACYCHGKIAAHKVPKIIEFRNEIAKSHTGKILRKYLVE